ncbi:MAG: DUF418 domain-containing protein [Erythrobacter sp.]
MTSLAIPIPLAASARAAPDTPQVGSASTRIAAPLGVLLIAMALLKPGVFMFACSGAVPLFQQPLASAGRMAFINCLMHWLVCAIILVGFAYSGALDRYRLCHAAFAIRAARLVISPPEWLRRTQALIA